MSVPAADKGRRRRVLDDEGEDEDLGTAPVTRPSECESEGEGADIELSEYESAVDESGDAHDETEEGSETETEEGSDSEEETGSETETEGGEEYTDDEGLEEERQSGDGEEQPDNDKPDDDEDKKNPAYVPRKGAFYEHDFRRGDEEPEKEVEDDSKPKKKLWQDEGKWVHDRYSEDSQAPKSREELIAIYGYDIRAADKPPEAPPRRPGRGTGPRRPKFQDFVPRMAVIDTTEDGSDSVPNLGDDELVLYNEPSSRYTRRNNMRNNETRRGGRGGGRGGNFRSNDVEVQNSNNRPDYTNRSGEGSNSQDNRRQVISQDIRTSEEFPSLEESARQPGPRDNRGGKRSDTYDRIRSDNRPQDRGPRIYQNDIKDYNRRGEFQEQGPYRDDNAGRYQTSQDSRRQEGNNRYQQGYRDDIRGRGGYNRNGNRNGQFNNGRSEKENWRSSPGDVREGYVRDDYSRNQQDQGFNRRPQYGGGDNRGPRGGHTDETVGYSGPNKRNSRKFDQPRPYQQQQQVMEEVPGGTREQREYTNSTFKGVDDKRIVANAGNGPSASGVGDNGDGSVSSSKNLVISNKENVQTINVTITSTTTEKKSYAKERRAKGARPGDASAAVTNAGSQHPAVSTSAAHYPGLPQSGMKIEQSTANAAAAAKRYSSQRQQGLGKGGFTEPPPVDTRGANLYNPALPPPSFFQGDHPAVAPTQHPVTSATGTVQDPAHFTPTMLPPGAATALPFGLAGVPVSSTGLALPPSAAGGVPTNPALFQPPTHPPPPTSIPAASAALMGAPYLPAGMMYGGAPRVPPPGAPAGFPLPMAYTSPPPPATVAATVVGNQPPPQGNTPQQSTAQSHKKVYRGDITYYAPELQQPSRTPQRRPKAAIPIIDPQEIRKQKQKEKMEQQRSTPEKSTASPGKQSSPAPGNSSSKAPVSTSHSTASSEQVATNLKSEVPDPSVASVPAGSSASTVPVSAAPAQVAVSSNKDMLSGPISEQVSKETAKHVAAGLKSDNKSDQKCDSPPLSVATQSFKTDGVKAETTISKQSMNKALLSHTNKVELTQGMTENSSDISNTQVQSVVNTPVNS